MLKYEDWLKTQIKYSDCKCGIYDCDKPGLYEGGDARCRFPKCEYHNDMRKLYLYYLYGSKINVQKEINVELAYQKEINVELAYQKELTRRQSLEKRLREALDDTN